MSLLNCSTGRERLKWKFKDQKSKWESDRIRSVLKKKCGGFRPSSNLEYIEFRYRNLGTEETSEIICRANFLLWTEWPGRKMIGLLEFKGQKYVFVLGGGVIKLVVPFQFKSLCRRTLRCSLWRS